ncbi:MAG: universal stress protein [Vicinamibacterales bacterium]|jgi:nucleotide-binding universal stress UspA family protein|nr:universal stress protein [Vicinamibacterales bacterium]
MKVLLAVDRSPCSEAAAAQVAHLAWPAGTEIEVVSVAHTRLPLIPEPMWFLVALHEAALDEARERATEQLTRVKASLLSSVPGATVTTAVLEGRPAPAIVEEARRWQADRVVVGCHDRSRVGRWLLGSVSRAVARKAPCPVDVVAPSH